MNVVHIITRLILGGAQENTLHTVEDQHRLFGDQVSLITGPPEGPEGSLLPRAQRAGFPLLILPEMRRSILPWKDLTAYRAIVKLLKTLRPQIVHTHSSKAGILGRAAAARLRIPCVHTIHGASFHYGQNPLAQQLYIALEKWAARRTARFISVADDMTDEYVRAGIASPDRFTTVYSGFDVSPYLGCERHRDRIRREYGFLPEDIVVGKIARLFHLKGHEFLIEAASEIIQRAPNVRFLFVGSGILRDRFEQMIASRGLQKNFVFSGLVPPERIPEMISAMDIVAHTSQWEGLARVLPQGLIAGKPVVSYDVGGAREVVIPGETGFLLPRDSVKELAEAIVHLALNPELRRVMGETGRNRFSNIFRHEFMTERIRSVYQQVLSAP